MLLRALLIAILVLSPAWGSGCGGEEPGAETSARIHVEDLRYARLPGGSRVLTGTFVNETEREVDAQVQVSLFDAHNRRIGSLQISLPNIAAGERHPFREYVNADGDVRGARVHRIFML